MVKIFKSLHAYYPSIAHSFGVTVKKQVEKCLSTYGPYIWQWFGQPFTCIIWPKNRDICRFLARGPNLNTQTAIEKGCVWPKYVWVLKKCRLWILILHGVTCVRLHDFCTENIWFGLRVLVCRFYKTFYSFLSLL